MRPKLLDLFCKAGGAAMGYHLAGYDVTGIDIEYQPRYPFKFVQADALEYLSAHGHEFDVIHASPPCQYYSVLTPTQYKHDHPDMIGDVRTALISTGKPYIIENVPGARRHLINPVMLCGTMFGLGIWRHRYFETNPSIVFSPATCRHDFLPVLISGTMRRKGFKRIEHTVQECKDASGIDWMTRAELDESIPPAYTEWLGARFLELIGHQHESLGGG